MGLISSTHAVSRYHIDGQFDDSVTQTILDGLIKHAIPKIESEYDEISAGWTPVESPYNPDFEKFSFQFGTYFLFSLRIDKKSIPAKLVQKYMAIEIEKKKEKSGRDFVSKNEKSEIKEHVTDILMHKIPAVPSIYDVLWNYEDNLVYFYTTQKAANELFETLFLKSFGLKAVRLFPYTIIETRSKFTDTQKEQAQALVPFSFSRWFMLDIATAYNKYKFLGNDFLTWIWFLIETDADITQLIHAKELISLEVGNSIVLENKLGDKSTEKISIKGDQAGLEEGTTALKKGAFVTQINLICKMDEQEYKFTIKGESFNVTGLKTPKIDLSGKDDEMEGLVLEKAYLSFKIFELIDTLFLKYIEQRTSEDWKNKGLKDITNWIQSY